jgi:hypothetical protein
MEKFSSIENVIHNGYTDVELEMLCKKRKRKIPILFWPTELYGFGKCYREWLGLSNLLPIPFYGDHGVALSNNLFKHEIDNKSNYHLTWNKYRYENPKNHIFKKLIYITNPWVTYRKKNKFTLKENRKGTIIFFSHTIVGIDLEEDNHDKYFKELNDLDYDLKPLVICLHMHDINKGLHKKLRKYGLPIITVGNSLNSDFVDRFYDLISNFKQATSNTIGSQLFYCTEIGMPYFLYGSRSVYVNKLDENMPLGKMYYYDSHTEKLSKEIKKSFSKLNKCITEEQQNLTISLLGLDAIDNKENILYFYKHELFKLFPYYLKFIFLNLFQKFQINFKKIF